MALVENTLFGIRDKVAIAIDRLQAFEPPEGYYLAFSGGKDSQTIYHLAVESGVKFDAHYNITGIDPPELVYFIRSNYPDVERHIYKKSMFQLIEDWGLPTRRRRFCCAELKEHGGEGRLVVTGVRWAESTKRKSRKPFEVIASKRENSMLFNDNEDERRLFENCIQKGKRVVNPIIDWEDADVWEYLNGRNIEHCILYDRGYTRIGCIGCPMAGRKIQALESYPKVRDNYKRAIARFLPKYIERRKTKGLSPFRDTVEDFWQWWIEDEPIDYSDSFLGEDE